MIKVNGYEITEKEFDMALEERRHVLKKNILDKRDVVEVKDILIDGALMLKSARDENTGVEQKDIDEMVNSIKKNFKTEKEFEEIISKTGDTLSSLRERVKRNLMLRNFVLRKFFDETEVSDGDLEKYYNQFPERFTKGEEVRASHILFNESDKDTALEVHEALTEGGDDFAEKAKLHSRCPSGENGGDLGFFDRGKMVPEFEKAAFETEVGQISDLIQTQFGYHIVKVTDRRAGGKFELGEIKEQLRQSMVNSIVNNKIMNYTQELRKSAEIIIDEDLLNKKMTV